jgi:hypothetical protein
VWRYIREQFYYDFLVFGPSVICATVQFGLLVFLAGPLIALVFWLSGSVVILSMSAYYNGREFKDVWAGALLLSLLSWPLLLSVLIAEMTWFFVKKGK